MFANTNDKVVITGICAFMCIFHVVSSYAYYLTLQRSVLINIGKNVEILIYKPNKRTKWEYMHTHVYLS